MIPPNKNNINAFIWTNNNKLGNNTDTAEITKILPILLNGIIYNELHSKFLANVIRL